MSTRQVEDDQGTVAATATSLSARDPTSRTPSRGSRKSRRSITPPGQGHSSSMMGDRTDKASKRSSRDITTDETVSILDPRRFTPTLHANLVSEILTLRRDQDDKIKLIESLEADLQTTKEKQESVQQDLTQTAKESRSLKRQMSLLEGGTSSALTELARERDEAVDSITEVRKRLDVAQKKIRSQEDDSQRVHDLFIQEKDEWADERRKYERKIHVAESRLKLVLDEVAAYQASQLDGAHPIAPESEPEEAGRDADMASIRTMSMTNSVRFSTANGGGSLQLNGHSLADELNFDGDDDDDDQTDVDGRESVLSNHTSPKHARTMSRDSLQSWMHRRNQSLESPKRPGSAARGRLLVNSAVLETLTGEDADAETDATAPVSVPKVTYIDTGIQYSPPPSPTMSATERTASQFETLQKLEGSASENAATEARQRQKRVPPAQPLIIEPSLQMVSAASQTQEEPLSPPRTPKSPFGPIIPPLEQEPPPMVSSSMQTEDNSENIQTQALQRLKPPPSPISIPSISVQPPTSRPATPRSPRLPQHFKHFGCQVNLPVTYNTCEASVQTEGIKIDKRLALLPAHLQPSAISSRPSSPQPSAPDDHSKNFTPLPGNLPPRNPRRLGSSHGTGQAPSSPPEAEDEELQNGLASSNDMGPLSTRTGAPVKRPRRYSSLFAGFETASSDEGEDFGDVDLSDSEYRTALSAPRPYSTSSRQGKRTSIGTLPTSPGSATVSSMATSTAKSVGTEVYSSYSLPDRERKGDKHGRRLSRTYEKAPAPPPPGSDRTSGMRKAAMIQSGMATHQVRSRTPSLPENPPFPIPLRASSRKTSISNPSDGRRSPSRGWHRRGHSRGQYAVPSLRKSRSAAALPRAHHSRRRGSGSPPPPPLSPSTEAPESPGLPPMPSNDITTPRMRDRGGSNYRRHKHQMSATTDHTNVTEPTSYTSTSQTTGIVDAIAQTMVGEWMFKYVRRRKSFGVPDDNSKDQTGNDRHKRWVWLAPYERAILWSSKQPSSGSALMGKTGRKLTIQSVLDVKDDNPSTKLNSPIFNRSILILTPQRALKFTATSSERHYLWLTALSFLAHSSQTVPEILSAPQSQVKRLQAQPPPQPQVQQPIPDFDIPRAKVKRGGIRDSIRLAKGKSGQRPQPPVVPSLPSEPSSRIGDVTSFRMTGSSGVVSTSHSRDDSQNMADPPFIPRFNDRNNPAMVHGRKRSNTGGHSRVPPPLSFRGFSGPASNGTNHHSTSSTANASEGTAGSSDIYQSQASSNTTWGMSQTASQRTSEASSRPGNFFDAIGTVRMEAFISPLAFSQTNEGTDDGEDHRYQARRRSKEIRRRRSRSRQRDSYGWRSRRGNMDDFYSGSKTAGEEEYFRDDPFKGF